MEEELGAAAKEKAGRSDVGRRNNWLAAVSLHAREQTGAGLIASVVS